MTEEKPQKTREKVAQTAKKDRNEFPCVTCVHAKDFSPWVTTPVGMLPNDVERIDDKPACVAINCKTLMVRLAVLPKKPKLVSTDPT
jgi:hypothetical protein